MNDIDKNIAFKNLGLNSNILKSLNKMGYLNPSPIQKKCIPYLLSGRDVLGMAQTGSGKTAAFALPFLNNLNCSLRAPQILILTPTRELAIQVSEAIKNFSIYMKNINIVTLYGGQHYNVQLRILKRGPQIVVGTPGRLLDHLQRKTLNLISLNSLVLDEADEMLKMGFIEDVESIMSKIPDNHQTALFSATMPERICRIARKFMKNPQEIHIQSQSNTRPDINQRYWIIYGRKTDALMRFLEVEKFDAAIIFVRTKNATIEISEILERNGYNSAALNGDMNQTLRENTLEKLRKGSLDILIATDVAARGLDVDRISLVINYDIPLNAESYIHRIGRTGRAGRSGKALLFIENRERRMLKSIERMTKSRIFEVKMPNADLLSQCRLEKFIKKIQIQLESKDLDRYRALLEKISPIKTIDIKTLAAILLKLAQKERPLLIKPDLVLKNNRKSFKKNMYEQKKENNIYCISIGKNEFVEARHIVGAIVNETKINNRDIGVIKIFKNHSTVEISKKITPHFLKKFNIYILNKLVKIELKRKNNFLYKNFKNNFLKKKKYKK